MYLASNTSCNTGEVDLILTELVVENEFEDEDDVDELELDLGAHAVDSALDEYVLDDVNEDERETLLLTPTS